MNRLYQLLKEADQLHSIVKEVIPGKQIITINEQIKSNLSSFNKIKTELGKIVFALKEKPKKDNINYYHIMLAEVEIKKIKEITAFPNKH